MLKSNYLLPNYNDGRFFISPILGCTGACCYCYLKLHNYNSVRKNMISTEKILETAQQCEKFTFGRNGTIISVGAWGDLFPRNNTDLIEHSVNVIVNLLSWGNPVQIMSKNVLCDYYVKKICSAMQYTEQLLYSTTITTLEKWKNIEPYTFSPIERLRTCYKFHKYRVSTNVLLKPFILSLTGAEIDEIASLLLKYQIDFCTVGIMYWDAEILKKVKCNSFLDLIFENESEKNFNYLDCNGDIILNSTSILSLRPHVDRLRENGIKTFFKSSCVSSNILHETNPSGYCFDKSDYCIQCGNCERCKS